MKKSPGINIRQGNIPVNEINTNHSLASVSSFNITIFELIYIYIYILNYILVEVLDDLMRQLFDGNLRNHLNK